MIRNALIVMCVAVLCITGGVMLIDDDADGAINIGILSKGITTGDDTNQSSPDYAYQYVDIYFNFDEIPSNTIYVLDGAEIEIGIPAGTVTQAVTNEIGLTLGGSNSMGYTIHGTANGAGKLSVFTVDDVGTPNTKNISIATVEDTTVYATSCVLTTPSTTVEVRETITITATVYPTNATYRDVDWTRGISPSAFITTGSTGTTLTGYFTETGDYTIYAGWETEVYKPTGTHLASIDITVGDLTEYYLAYDANSGTGGPNIQEYGPTSDPSHTFYIPDDEPTHNDPAFEFTGWSTDPDADAAEYHAGDPFTLYASDPIDVLYAVWGPASTPTIRITGPSEVEVGDAFTFTAEIVGGNMTDKSLTWTIRSGSNLVELDSISINNRISGTALAAGDVVFRATSNEDSSLYLDRLLTIEGPDPIVIDITGETSIKVGEEFDIWANASGGVEHSGVTWSTVSGSEYIQLESIQVPGHWRGQGIAPGEAVFRATSNEDSSVYEDWTLTILPPDPIIITINGPTSIDVGEKFTLAASVSGGTLETSQKVTWSVTSGAEYVTIDSIQMNNNYTGTGAANGVTVFRATSIEDPQIYEEWILTVGDGLDLNIIITGDTIIQVGESFDISATVVGGSSGNNNITWSVTSGSSYVDLDDDPEPNHISGTGAAVGSVTFKATLTSDTDVYEVWTLSVVAQAVIMPTSITITGPGNVMLGDTGQIHASILPTNAPNRGVLWTIQSGDGIIEYVTDSTYRGGVLEFSAIAVGSVTIRATSTASSDIYATYTLTVLNPEAPENHGTLNVNNVIKALADAVFGGNTTIAGIVIYAGILLAIFLLIREPLPVVLISIPVTLILRLLRVLDNDLTVLLIIISVLGLAMLARNMWRD